MPLLNKSVTINITESAWLDQFERLNTSLERLCLKLGAPTLPSEEEISLGSRAYVGEPLNEFEAALKEHAELSGINWKSEDEL